MGNGSSAYADLGGGIGGGYRPPPRPVSIPPGAVGGREHRHIFDAVSGWCGCGRRDDGRAAGR